MNKLRQDFAICLHFVVAIMYWQVKISEHMNNVDEVAYVHHINYKLACAHQQKESSILHFFI